MSDAPPVQPPRRKPAGRFHHGDLAQALRATAAEILDAEGPGALTLRRVADAVGVTEPAVYRHYASKDALLGAVVADGYEGLLAACFRAADPADAPLAAAASALGAYVRFAAAHPHWFRLWSSRWWYEGQAAQQQGHDLPQRRASVAPLQGLLAAGLASDAPIDDVFRLLWGLAQGLSTLVVERAFQLVDTDEARLAAADDALRLALDALRARHPR
jgi:AcrR family transcriptional regulator